MVIHESAEMYLETILMLEINNNGHVHAVDIANSMGYSKPTISEQMKRFRENGYIDIDEGDITLTPKGREIAERIYDRHRTLADMLLRLGVDERTAYADACKIEHDISESTYECLKRHMELH